MVGRLLTILDLAFGQVKTRLPDSSHQGGRRNGRYHSERYEEHVCRREQADQALRTEGKERLRAWALRPNGRPGEPELFDSIHAAVSTSHLPYRPAPFALCE